MPQILPFSWFVSLLFSMVMMWSVVSMYSWVFVFEKQSFSIPIFHSEKNGWIDVQNK